LKSAGQNLRVQKWVAVISVLLLAVKFSAYYFTRSVAILTDALESIVNVAAGFIGLYSLSVAAKPKDKDHPYGHGKVEFIAAAVEGGMVLAAALVAVVKAIDELIHNVELHIARLHLGLIMLGIALAVNGLLGSGLKRIGRRQDSATLVADGQHLLSDAITSLAAALGILVVHFTGWKYADPIAAIAVAIYIATMGVALVRDAVAGLMDRQDVSDQILLRSILDAHVDGREPRICSYHKLRHRHNGRYHWVDFHIMVPADWDVRRGHQVASTIEYEIEQALGVGNATAHVEPCPDPGCAACKAEEGSGFGVQASVEEARRHEGT